MSIRRHLAFAVLFAALATAPARAQQGPPPGGSPDGAPGGRPPRPPIDTALDANGDGTIDAGEIANSPVALRKLDKNGDGKLTADEYLPPRRGGSDKGTPPDGAPVAQGEQRPRRIPPIVAAIDANGDGVLDAGEIASAPSALKKLDKNGDGKLSPDEYRPPRPDGPATEGGSSRPAKAKAGNN